MDKFKIYSKWQTNILAAQASLYAIGRRDAAALVQQLETSSRMLRKCEAKLTVEQAATL